MAGKTPRGIRNNNPLNIRRTKTVWQGMKPQVTDKEFVEFTTMAYGYRAAWKTLQTYYKRIRDRKKHYTVENLICRWAQPQENDTTSYIRNVLALSGIGGQENLLPPENVLSYNRLSSLIAAMTVMENGIRPYQVNTEAIYQGYKLAFPENAQELDDSLLCQDEYADW